MILELDLAAQIVYGAVIGGTAGLAIGSIVAYLLARNGW